MKSNSSPQDEEIIKILRELASRKAPYPPELLAARRAAFMNQVAQGGQAEVRDGLTLKDQEIIHFLKGLKSFEAEYPSKLLTARRMAIRRQIAQMRRARVWAALRSIFQQRPVYPTRTWSVSLMNFALTSLIVLSVAAFAGFMIYGSLNQSPSPASSPGGISQHVPFSATQTSVAPVAKIICKPGYVPPLCLAKEFDKTEDLTYVGNGSARPAVAKDTSRIDGGIHKAANVNDGLYGPGASWVSDSPNSWIKIDLGRPMMINTVKIGRDRLGKLNGRNPGQFVIALALSDDVYADGNSSNDDVEYRQVFNSAQSNFNGVISGSETVTAQFNPQSARFLKITFQQAGTAIDEVEAFMVKNSLPGNPTKTNGSEVLLKTATPVPTNTPLPTDTPLPTSTPVPSDTPVPPTDTPRPTSTPVPSDTPVPPTDTPLPTSTPVPSDTPVPPTDTPRPASTPVPSDTPAPPTDTSVPPSEMPIPQPSDTPAPIDTSVPTDIPVVFHVNFIHLTKL
jgi:hypothetical protein